MSKSVSRTAPEQAEQVTPDAIMQLGLGVLGLEDAAERGRAGAVHGARRPVRSTAEALRERLGLHPRSAHGLLRRPGRARHARARRTAATRTRRRPSCSSTAAKPSYVGGMLEMANARLYAFWGSLTEALRTGKPQNEAKRGDDFFAALYADPERLAQFVRAMTGLSAGAAQAIAAKFPWRDYGSVIDIGCAEGAVPVQIALAHDAPDRRRLRPAAVGPIFEAYVAGFGLADRLRFHAGDFFADPLPQRRRAGHGAHPARLGPRGEARAAARRRTTRCPTAGR